MRVNDDLNGCLLARFRGPSAPAWLLKWLDDGLAGVVLFAENITGAEQVRSLVSELRAHNPRALVAADEEGGIVTRMEAAVGSSFPGNAALGAVDDLAATSRVARGIGAMLAASGLNLELAPVADVASNPDNPVIGVRSFGADPERVAAHTAAFVTGVQACGVAACAKHFPGHGRTGVDSHLELGSVTASLAELADSDLVPFRAAIAAGVRTVMTAHVRFPAVDDKPATISRRWLTEVLRGELGFAGVIITDALDMAAIGDSAESAAGAVGALAAGADLLCLSAGRAAQQRAVSALEAAVADGSVSRRRIAEAAERVQALADWARPARPALVPDPEVGRCLARRSLVIAGSAGVLPAPPYVLDAGGRMSVQLEDSAASLLGLLRDRLPGTEGVRLTVPAGEADDADLTGLDSWLAAAAGRPLVLVVRDAHRRPWQRELLRRALAARPDAVVVGTGTAHDRELARSAYLGTLGASRVSLTAAADLLAGSTSAVSPCP
jgi:beta-N-acetylhexosaminidase